MRSLLCVIGGSAVIVATLLDVLRTTVSLQGGGAVAVAVADAVWSMLARLGRATGSRRPLLVAGPAVMIATLLTWGLLAVVGWTMLFASSETAVVDAQRGTPASLWERAYFMGSTLITLGLGDFRPQGQGWHFLTVVASAYGFFMVTLAVAYLLPVVTAVLQSRQLALSISYLAPAGDQLVPRAWDGIGFDTLGQQLMAMTPMVIQASQNYLAYPVLRHFHQAEPEASLSLSLVHLDRALFLLEHGVAEGHRPPRLVVEPLRRAIGSVARCEIGDDALPGQALLAPRLQGLIEACIPTVEPEEYQQAALAEQQRRRVLLALMLDDGWGSVDMDARTPGAARSVPPPR